MRTNWRGLVAAVASLSVLAACESEPAPEAPDLTQPDTTEADTSEADLLEDTATEDTPVTPLPDGCDCLTADDCPAAEALCHEAACVACACSVVAVDDGSPCDDGDLCTEADACTAGVCDGEPVVCDDGESPCDEGYCDPAIGCAIRLVGICDDGNRCTVDSCTPGESCPEGAHSEGERCYLAIGSEEEGSLDEAVAACRAKGTRAGAIVDAADNGRVRAQADAVCGTGSEVLLALTRHEAPVWADGSSESFTAWADGQPGEGAFVVMRADGTWETREEGEGLCFVCVEARRAVTCSHAPVDPDSPLIGPEVCNGLDDDCNGLVDDGDLCDDGNVCTENLCLGRDGCSFESPADLCDDENPCTVDSCDPELGCAHVPDDALCDDGIACTVDTCDAQLGCLHTAHDAACDDGAACTTEHCDEALGCVYETDDAACDDGIDCTADRCEPFAGCVNRPDDAVCDDDNVCTDNRCDPGAGCLAEANVAPCDDGDVCTALSTCSGGACVGVEPVVCDDMRPCTADRCDPGVGCVAPFVSECDYPGPVAGYYEGPWTASGLVSGNGPFPDVQWNCAGIIQVVVDASGEIDARGLGHANCAIGQELPEPRGGKPGWVVGTLDGFQIDAILTTDSFEIGFTAEIELDGDDVPVAMNVDTAGQVRTADMARFVGASSVIIQGINLGAYPTFSPYHLSGRVERVPIPGTCCGPLGCEELEDFACHAIGHDFSPREAGLCCIEDDCTLRTREACRVFTPDAAFVPTRFGSCCIPDGSCEAIPELLCDTFGGAHEPGLGCADNNGDGYADACGVPPDFGYTEASNCVLNGDTLTANVGGVVTLNLVSSWAPDGSGAVFSTTTGVGLETPFGTVQIPTSSSISVACGAGFALSGQSSGMPSFAGVSAFPNVNLTSQGSSFALGYGFGYELRALGVEAPVADGRSYLFATASNGTTLSLGSNASIATEPGNEALIAVDPTDPAIIVSAGGDALGNATGGLINSVGFGFSRGGRLTWRSVIPVFDGERFEQAIATGHIYRSGEFALIPIAGLPANIFLDGDLLLNVGPAVDLIEPIGSAILSGSTSAISSALQALGDSRTVSGVLGSLEAAGNANSLSIGVGPISITVGRAAWVIQDGAFRFTGEAFTPGAALASGGAGELFEAFSALTIQATGKAWGYVDSAGFQFGTEADLVAGPFRLNGVRLIIDSSDGIRIEGGRFKFDFTAFLRQLKSLLDCDFSASGASCSVFGIEVASFSGGLTDRGFELDGRVGVPVLGEVQIGALIGEDGDFLLRGSVSGGIPGFQTGSVEVVVSREHFAVSTMWSKFSQTIRLAGEIRFNGDFILRGFGNFGVLGFPMSGVTVTMTNSRVIAEGQLTVIAGSIDGILEVPFNDPLGWTFEGRGVLSPFGYRLGEVSASASGADAALSLEGQVGIGSSDVTLSGEVSPSNFNISAALNLQIGRFSLGNATVTLSSSGLNVAGRLAVLGGGINVSGRVETNGNFRLSSSANGSIPIAGLNLSASATIERTGGAVRAFGNASLSFAGVNFGSSWSFSTSGAFAWNAGVTTSGRIREGWPVKVTIASWEGSVRAGVSNGSFSVRFSGQGCAGSVCASLGGSVSSSGRVCVRFPVVGTKCIRVL